MIRERRRHAVVANAAGRNRMEQASRVHSSYNNIPQLLSPSSSSSSPFPSPSSQNTVLVLNQLAWDPLTLVVSSAPPLACNSSRSPPQGRV
jgi:hypothetical protein